MATDTAKTESVIKNAISLTAGSLTSVYPVDPRITHKSDDASVGGVVDIDCFVFHGSNIDEAVRVGLHTIVDALLTTALYGSLSENFTAVALVPQTLGGDGVESPRSQRCPVEVFAVGAKSNAVGSKGEVSVGHARVGNGVDLVAPDDGKKLLFGVDSWVSVQVAPAGAHANVDNHNTVPAFGRGVGKIRHALVTGDAGEVGSQVEADIIEVRVWVCNVGGEKNCADDLVGGEVDGDELGATVGGVGQHAGGGVNGSAGIKDP